jgi:hypothetical protein
MYSLIYSGGREIDPIGNKADKSVRSAEQLDDVDRRYDHNPSQKNLPIQREGPYSIPWRV